MTRARILLAALLLVLPLPATAQQTAGRNGRSGDTEAVEAQVFMGALEAIGRLHLDQFSDSALWAQALDGLIESLDDPYASVFTPDEVAEFEEENTGNYAGIGVQITELNDLVTVTAVFRDTPADQAGVQVGDVIVGVDGEGTREWTTQQVSNVIRGPVGSPVEVEVEREGYDRPIPIEIVRDEVHVSALAEDRLSNGIEYVAMDRVARNVAHELDSILRENRDAPGLILDLRGNPGGYLDESLYLSDLFLAPGQTLASTRNRAPGRTSQTDEAFTDRMPARVPDMPLVVLVDEYSASAAEILAGALQDHDRALIVGQRTFGKGVVQTVLDLPHGRKLRLTTGTWHTPLGRSLHRPRASDGRPLEESLDTFPRVDTASGRELLAAGGIFPDLVVEDDTLRLAERELLRRSAEAGVPLPLRILEFAFAESREQSGAETPRIREAPFEALVERLRADGVPGELLDEPLNRDYLRWRARIEIANRMGADYVGEGAEIRMERDPVLATAVELLEGARSQTALYAAAAAKGGNGRTHSSEPSAR
jgi:carboxyl-terminal processing protease